MNDKIKYKGYVIITDKKGKHRFDNVVTQGFYQLIANLATGISSDIIDYFGFGTGTTIASNVDTELVSESGDRLQVTFKDSVGGIMHFQVTVNGGQLIYTWREIGLFTASTGGVMTNRVNVNYVHSLGESITLDYYIQKQ